MMAWKTREGLLPPPTYWADFVAATNLTFPGATLSAETLRTLYDLAVDEWRQGRQVHLVVRQLCSCDGRNVVPSPAATARLSKVRGIARPPGTAERGSVFGLDELREPAAVGKLLAKEALLRARIDRERRKKSTPDRDQTIAQAAAELEQVHGQLAAARESLRWKPARLPPPPDVPEAPPPQDAPPKAKRGRRTKKIPASEPVQIPTATDEDRGLDDDIADELINELAKRA